ncbi:MAG: hypothetical protein QOG63_750 [Thermoleophilaceae bacterium]|jgi:hypothetical protein|nr:hypothetical protein [Thermoleophilaceae bacterium]
MATADAPVPESQPARRRPVPIVIGSLLAVVGALLALAGGALLVVFGSDGLLESGRHPITTPTRALVSRVATIEGAADAAKALGNVRIGATSDAPGVFVGVGPAAAVDRYLAGVEIDRVSDFGLSPFKLTRARRDGSAKPDPPADQSFWVARTENGSLNWKIADGDFRFVVMNADTSPGVSTGASFSVELPHVTPISIAILVVGLLILSGGVALVVVGVRRR